MCYLPHTFGDAYALYAMKRNGLARVSKIDVDALLDKTSCSPRVAIVFPTFDVGGHHGATFANSGFFEVKKKLRDYSKSEWHKFLYLDDPKVKSEIARQPRASAAASNEFKN